MHTAIFIGLQVNMAPFSKDKYLNYFSNMYVSIKWAASEPWTAPIYLKKKNISVILNLSARKKRT